ncbi:MAG: hypothetical protein R6V26_05900 [Roseovarius sp.]
MAKNGDNIILEQPCIIREDIKQVGRMPRGRRDDPEIKVDGHTGVLIAPGRTMHDIDSRIERLETKNGGPS